MESLCNYGNSSKWIALSFARGLSSCDDLQRIRRWCTNLKDRRVHLPQSNMGKALSYLLGNWEQISRYLEDGRLEIDNNPVENAIRPTAIGKKNWLFMGSETSGETSAILYTLIESTRRRGIDPFAYLRDALTRLPRMTTSQISELLPATWAAAQKKAA